MKSTAFHELKDLLSVKTTKESFATSLVSEGIPKGSITEISGPGKTELVLALLKENQSATVAWIEEKFSVYPFGFIQRSVSLNRVLFVDAGSETCWSALQILKSQAFQILIIYSDNLDLQDL